MASPPVATPALHAFSHPTDHTNKSLRAPFAQVLCSSYIYMGTPTEAGCSDTQNVTPRTKPSNRNTTSRGGKSSHLHKLKSTRLLPPLHEAECLAIVFVFGLASLAWVAADAWAQRA